MSLIAASTSPEWLGPFCDWDSLKAGMAPRAVGPMFPRTLTARLPGILEHLHQDGNSRTAAVPPQRLRVLPGDAAHHGPQNNCFFCGLFLWAVDEEFQWPTDIARL